MSRFSIRHPYLVIVICLMICVGGVTMMVRMPVDLFPPIKIPVVVVATFFNGMPPEQVETDITGRFERFFTLGAGIEHIESRSLTGVSLIKIFFQPGVNADAAVTTIANLAMADLRRLPPGTLPPVVLKFDASSLPVCLVTLKGEGLNETQLRDLGQFEVRDEMANVPGASVPQPFGGRYRQIMVYVDPLKLEAYGLSVMDVVHRVNDANLILPAGDVKIGPYDYNVYANSQINPVQDINQVPLKMVGEASVLVGDVGKAVDGAAIQYCIVRVDGQRSVYLPVLKQGGDDNTITIVNGIRDVLKDLVDVPKQLAANVVFDQSIFVRSAIENLIHEGLIGLILTALMILIFLGSLRSTVAVLLCIPLSALAAFIALALGGSTINVMLLGGLALAFSRLIDNSVVVLENIHRHMEMGEAPDIAAEHGGQEVALPVLSATLATAVVFFPVIFLYGVSRFLFSALALGVVLSLFGSYFVALSVVPLFCAKLLRARAEESAAHRGNFLRRFNVGFNRKFQEMLAGYGRLLNRALNRPVFTMVMIVGLFLASLAVYPFIGKAYFPRTDPGQFVITVKAKTGLRVERTEKLVAQIEKIVREVVPPRDLDIVLSNIGVMPGFSSIYTPNSGPHTAFIQVGLRSGHREGSYVYLDRVRQRVNREVPEVSAYYRTGGLVGAILDLGMPAPLDIAVTGLDTSKAYGVAAKIEQQVRALPSVADVLVPVDVDYPALDLNINRVRAGELGVNEKDAVNSVVTALTSDEMIAPSYWIDPKTGNDYFLTVQYPEDFVKNLQDLGTLPLRAAPIPRTAPPENIGPTVREEDKVTRNGPDLPRTTRLENLSQISHAESPTEVDHYQLQRVVDIYVAPKSEDLKAMYDGVTRIIAQTKLPEGIRINVRGAVQAMRTSFKSFALGLILATVLVYLILAAQFESFLDPLLILLAVPTGLTGVLLALFLTGTTVNIMSLMGVVMMVGIVVSNSILIVDFTRRLRREGRPLLEAVSLACRIRLRPILMTSIATLVGLLPLAAKLGTGSEAYAPLARAIIGGLAVSLVLTVFIVPAAYLLFHAKRADRK